MEQRRPAPARGRRRCSSKFVTVQLYTDFVPIDSITADQRKKLAEKNQEPSSTWPRRRPTRSTSSSLPTASPSASIGGYNEPPVFRDFLNKALEKARGGMNVAQAPWCTLRGRGSHRIVPRRDKDAETCHPGTT